MKKNILLVATLLVGNTVSAAHQAVASVAVAVAKDEKLQAQGLAACKAAYVDFAPLIAAYATLGKSLAQQCASRTAAFAKDIIIHPIAYMPSKETVFYCADQAKTCLITAAGHCKEFAKAHPKETAVMTASLIAGVGTYKTVKKKFDKKAPWAPTFAHVAIGGVAGFYAAVFAAKMTSLAYDGCSTFIAQKA